MATVIEIVEAHLKAGGFSGLRAPCGECGCEIGDLQPCGSDFSGCEAGYKHMDPRVNDAQAWGIWKQKEPPTAEQWASQESY